MISDFSHKVDEICALLGYYAVSSGNFLLVKVNQSHYRPEVPRGFQEVKVPRLRDNGPGWW